MKTLKEINIIADIVRQGKIFLDGGQLKYSDLTSDKVLMMSVNESWNDRTYCNTYYDHEIEIFNKLESYRIERKLR